MPTGKGIVRSMRVWADLDLLLTASSITEAHQLTLDPDGRLGSQGTDPIWLGSMGATALQRSGLSRTTWWHGDGATFFLPRERVGPDAQIAHRRRA